ncbi:DapH/DapD/GlmU-related protein [Metapseudomonas otitidis]|uniref:DapH/DapD/GlmU-related protein n=1 Tax=Metapseudomonas otitidis TaxID=319939 RepID=UPI0013F5F1B7|nr:DapH/DapD/GlmU-related protein [Pseudomonas otitidis]
MISNYLLAALKSYGVLGAIRLSRDLILSKIIFPKERLIRYPFYIRGFRFIAFSGGLTSGVGLRIDVFPQGSEKAVLKIGRNCQFNDYVHIGVAQEVEIGSNVLIASKVFISDHNHGSFSPEDGEAEIYLPPAKRRIVSKPVIISDDVWLGEGVQVLPGVSIGKGAVVGAGAVVTRNIPAYSISVGVPARVVKVFDFNLKHWVSIVQ